MKNEKLHAYGNGIINYFWVVDNKLDNRLRGVIIQGRGGGGTRIFDLSGFNRYRLRITDRSYVCVGRTDQRAVLPSRSESFKNKLFRITHKCIIASKIDCRRESRRCIYILHVLNEKRKFIANSNIKSFHILVRNS